MPIMYQYQSNHSRLLMHLLGWLVLLLEARSACTLAIPSQDGTSRFNTNRRSSSSSGLLSASSTNSQQEEDYGELPTDLPRRDDVLKILAALRRACKITTELQPVDTDALDSAVQKDDLSPVTVADFAAQASCLHALQAAFPDAGFIAEEDSAALLADAALLERVAHASGLATTDVLTAIDLGKSYATWGDSRPETVFCLDPIDGTRGFLRGRKPGGQYAIALALLQDGVPVIGVLGCPNLPVQDATTDMSWRSDETIDNNQETRGCVFVAVQGGGCYQLSVVPSKRPAPRLHVTSQGSIQNARFCIGVEKYSDAQGQTVGMARYLQGDDAVEDDGVIVRARRMDSQAKHGVIARGGAEWYVRLPKPGYVEWIWDHAAGYVVATEAGGAMTDTAGRPIDFGLGAQLSPTVKGVLMSCGGDWHKALVEAYAAVDGSKDQP